MGIKSLVVIVVSGIAVIVAAAFYFLPDGTGIDRAVSGIVPTGEDADFEKLGEPKPGDWLYSFPEPGQTFAEYIEKARNVKEGLRCVIYLQPLGEFDERYERMLARMGEYAGIFFNCRAVVLKPLPLPKNGWVESRGQYNAEMVRRQMGESLPDDAIVMVGVTNKDLFSAKLNFVFGVGSLHERTGIYSLARLESEDEKLFCLRSLKLMNHEIGHIFGIEHCIAYKCSMNGANSLAEADTQPIHFCPIDAEKLRWNVKFDAISWHEKLGAFYRDAGLRNEADWIERRLERLRLRVR